MSGDHELEFSGDAKLQRGMTTASGAPPPSLLLFASLSCKRAPRQIRRRRASEKHLILGMMLLDTPLRH